MGIGHQIVTAEAAADGVPFPIDEDEAFGLTDGEGVEDDLIGEGEDSRGGADAEGEGEDGGGGEGWGAEEGANGVAEVVGRSRAAKQVSQTSRNFLLRVTWASAAEFEGGAAGGLSEAGSPDWMRSAMRRSRW